MLFSGKENVFMCLVAFQNIFRKIFSSVWKRSWKRRRKRQNLEKPGQTQKNTARSGDWRCDLAIDGTISDRDRRRDLAKRRSQSARTVLREITISDCDRRCDLTKRRSRSVLREIVSSDRDRRRDLVKHHSRWSRSRERCFARDRAARSRVLSLSHSPFARALFTRPQFWKSFEVKIGTEMNFRGQCYYFTVNWKWFSENSIFQTTKQPILQKMIFWNHFHLKQTQP